MLTTETAETTETFPLFIVQPLHTSGIRAASLIPTQAASGGVLEAGRVQQEDGGGGRAGRADRTVDEADKAGQQLRVEGDGQSGEVARHQWLFLLLSGHNGRGSGVAGGGPPGGAAAGGRETWAQSDITPLSKLHFLFDDYS